MFLFYNLPGIIWGIIILLLLGMPGDKLPGIYFLNIPYFDKIVHVFLFLIFVFLLKYGYTKQHSFKILKQYSFILSLSTGILYGGLTEIFQGSIFQSRTSDLFDFTADVAGCFSGLLLWYLIRHKIFSF